MKRTLCVAAMLLCLNATGRAESKYIAECGRVSQHQLSGLFYFTPFIAGGTYCLADTSGLGAALAHSRFVYVWGMYESGAIVLDCGLQMTVNHIDTCICCRNYRDNPDGDPSEGFDISDLTAIIDYAYMSFQPLTCFEEADRNADGVIDISDISDVIFCLFLNPGQCLTRTPCRDL